MFKVNCLHEVYGHILAALCSLSKVVTIFVSINKGSVVKTF